MARVGSADTAPEMALRRALWALGLRYRANHRVHGMRPDIVFVGARVAVFVDGCFWHGCPRHYRAPSTNAAFWAAKVRTNRARDRRQGAALAEAGWTVIRLWEHEITRSARAAARKVAEVV